MKYMGVITLALIDDILVFLKNNEEHKEHIERVFEVLRVHKMYANSNNYQFFGIKLDTSDMCCLTKVP